MQSERMLPTIMMPGKDKKEDQEKVDRELKKMIEKQHADPDFLFCRHGEKDWMGADPCCAFNEDGTFRENNWSCVLMSKVRDLMGQWSDSAYGHCWWDDDQHYGVLYIQSWVHGKEVDSYLQGTFVLLDWYKSRGKTDSFRILQGDVVREGTEKDALEIVKIYMKDDEDTPICD